MKTSHRNSNTGKGWENWFTFIWKFKIFAWDTEETLRMSTLQKVQGSQQVMLHIGNSWVTEIQALLFFSTYTVHTCITPVHHTSARMWWLSQFFCTPNTNLYVKRKWGEKKITLKRGCAGDSFLIFLSYVQMTLISTRNHLLSLSHPLLALQDASEVSSIYRSDQIWTVMNSRLRTDVLCSDRSRWFHRFRWSKIPFKLNKQAQKRH